MAVAMSAVSILETSDGRRAERVRTLIGARAIFNNGNSSIDCQIRNLSSTGAKLTVSESVGLPQSFLLEIPSKHKSYRSEIRWRSHNSVGVEFVDSPGDVEGHVALGQSMTQGDTVESLRAENEILKRRVVELVHRLADLGHSE